MYSEVQVDKAITSYAILLPGSVLNLSHLLAKKKFAGKGNKDGAVSAFMQLESSGLGKLVVTKGHRGTANVSIIFLHTPLVIVVCSLFTAFSKLYKFEKNNVPKDQEGKVALADKLLLFGVTLKDYIRSIEYVVWY